MVEPKMSNVYGKTQTEQTRTKPILRVLFYGWCKTPVEGSRVEIPEPPGAGVQRSKESDSARVGSNSSVQDVYGECGSTLVSVAVAIMHPFPSVFVGFK
jgi:hypothetical protein